MEYIKKSGLVVKFTKPEPFCGATGIAMPLMPTGTIYPDAFVNGDTNINIQTLCGYSIPWGPRGERNIDRMNVSELFDYWIINTHECTFQEFLDDFQPRFLQNEEANINVEEGATKVNV
jgi:hypothetical protein